MIVVSLLSFLLTLLFILCAFAKRGVGAMGKLFCCLCEDIKWHCIEEEFNSFYSLGNPKSYETHSNAHFPVALGI